MSSADLLRLAMSMPEGDDRDRVLRLSRVRQLTADITDCTNCPPSVRPVPPDGEFPARVLVVGEAPKVQDMEWGKPFVGRTGRLLRAAIEEAGLTEFTALAYRQACRHSHTVRALERTIDLADPWVIVPVGADALIEFARPGETPSITNAVGRAWWLDGRLIVPEFHPGYVLRNDTLRAEFQGVFHRVSSYVRGLAEFPTRPKNYLPEWELSVIAEGRYNRHQANKMADHYRRRQWVAVHSDVIGERMVIAEPGARVPEAFADVPRYRLDEVVKLRGATVGQFLGVHLAKREFGAEVLS